MVRIEKVLTGEKVGFREWRNQFKHALCQARPGPREVLEELEEMATAETRDGASDEEVNEENIETEGPTLRNSMRTCARCC